MRGALGAIISAIVLAACNSAGAQENASIHSSGGGTQRAYDVGGFNSVALGGHYNVVISVGPAASVRAEGPAEQLDRLVLEVKDNTLHVKTQRGNWRFQGAPATIYVTAPALRAASIGGSGNMRIDRVEGDGFSASIGGSGDIEIGTLRVQSANFSIAGSGNIRASGRAANADLSIAGSGDMDMPSLESRTAAVSVVGAGNIRARATQSASVSIMGSGDVELLGGARCEVSKLGSGSVRCGDA